VLRVVEEENTVAATCVWARYSFPFVSTLSSLIVHYKSGEVGNARCLPASDCSTMSRPYIQKTAPTSEFDAVVRVFCTHARFRAWCA